MNNINPLQLLSMLRGGNPQQIATQIIQQNFGNDPMMNNLLRLAQSGNEKELRKYAIDLFKSRGKDFNTEMESFMRALKNL